MHWYMGTMWISLIIFRFAIGRRLSQRESVKVSLKQLTDSHLTQISCSSREAIDERRRVLADGELRRIRRRRARAPRSRSNRLSIARVFSTLCDC